MAPIRGNQKEKSLTPQASSSKREHVNLNKTVEHTLNSRMKEKAELKNLNDRLATYIETVRKLESEVSTYRKQVQILQESKTSEITNIQTIYDNQIKDLQATVDDVSIERAKLEIDFAKSAKEIESLTDKLRAAGSKLLDYNDITERNKVLLTENQKMQKNIKSLEADVKKQSKTIEELKKNLEAETISRVSLENKYQTVSETLEYRTKMWEEAIHVNNSFEQIETVEEHDGGSQVANDRPDEVYCSLQNLRDYYENDLISNRDKIDNLYKKKIEYYESNIKKNSQLIHKLNESVNSLEAKNAVLSHRIVDLEKSLSEERTCYKNDKEFYENEISRLRSEMAQQLQDYQDLMDTKILLDLEIAAYRRLIESEESRLNLSTGENVSGSGTTHTAKRKRTMAATSSSTNVFESDDQDIQDFNISSTSNGPIEIIDVCKDGMYVKLFNKSEQEISLAGWQVVRKVDDKEIIYKFHRSIKLDAGATVTIWSSSSQVSHEPPSNLVMKNLMWLTGDSTVTNVVNNEGEEIAHHKRVKSFESIRTRRLRNFRYRPEELFHQRAAPNNANNDSRCSIM